MRIIYTFLLITLFSFTAVKARQVCDNDTTYCDTTAGRIILNNGDFSKTYCTQTAVQDFQGVRGCCVWAGGVIAVKMGKVLCADGSISPICSIQDTRLMNSTPYLYQQRFGTSLN